MQLLKSTGLSCTLNNFTIQVEYPLSKMLGTRSLPDFMEFWNFGTSLTKRSEVLWNLKLLSAISALKKLWILKYSYFRCLGSRIQYVSDNSNLENSGLLNCAVSQISTRFMVNIQVTFFQLTLAGKSLKILIFVWNPYFISWQQILSVAFFKVLRSFQSFLRKYLPNIQGWKIIIYLSWYSTEEVYSSTT
jgi:hypothetical protein